MRVFLLLIGALFATSLAKPAKKEIPSYIRLCHKNDPKINECFKDSAQELMPKLGYGVPEMFIPPLDPLRLPEMSLVENAFNAKFNDIIVDGMTKCKVLDAEVDFEKVLLRVRIMTPWMRIRSKYTIDGKLLILQLHGSGQADSNFTNILSESTLTGKIIRKDGADYANFDNCHTTLEIGGASIYFADLFPDAELNSGTNNVINDNIKEVLKELLPLITGTIEEFIKKVSKGTFTTFSIDELFPPK